MKKKRRGRPKGTKNKDKQMLLLKEVEPEKVKLIKEIWKLQPEFKDLEIDLTKYTVKQLVKHIELVKRKRR